jgi:UDP-N-acetyl-2-amino-2-deoxyglucuronate dehydrogenase
MRNFALLGAAGFVAPRHFQAIRDSGQRLLVAADPHDSVGALDRYFPDACFFKDQERFQAFVAARQRLSDSKRIHYVSVCTPNDLHLPHVRMALQAGAHSICEKPLVVEPADLDLLAEIEKQTGRRVFTILQLRYHPAVTAWREKLASNRNGKPANVQLRYVTRRGPWYHVSWKGEEERSGGLAMNIGIHLFDLLIWLFGSVADSRVDQATPTRMAGAMRLAKADVRWFLSIAAEDLPEPSRSNGADSFRQLTIDGDTLNLSTGFADLHTCAYQEILAGRGFGIEDVRPSIVLADSIRQATNRFAKQANRPQEEPEGRIAML